MKPQLPKKPPQIKPRQKVKMTETENGPVRPVSAASSCPTSKGFYTLLNISIQITRFHIILSSQGRTHIF
jgi:hypothetical protein